MANISTVLMVDDNQSDHIISKVAVEAYDSSIAMHSVYDGQEALDLLATLESPPEVIFLDINMPGMDGHEFLVEYEKRRENSSVVVMLTTSDQASDKERCLAYSFVKEYIMKPLESNDLEVVSKLL